MLVTVTDCDWLLPTVVPAKVTVEGVAERKPGVVGEDATPESAIVVVLVRCFPLLPIPLAVRTDRAPVKVPAVCGEKLTYRFAVCSGGTLRGRFGPAKLKPAPVTVACEIVRLDLPLLLVTAMARVLMLPAAVLRFMLELAVVIWPTATIGRKKKASRTKYQGAKLLCDTRGDITQGSLSPCSTNTGGMIEQPAAVRRSVTPVVRTSSPETCSYSHSSDYYRQAKRSPKGIRVSVASTTIAIVRW